MKTKLLVGLVGRACSGKDTIAGYLIEDFGFQHISTSDIVRHYAEEKALGEPTREVLRAAANHIRSEHGPDYLVKRAILRAGERTVISGIRAIAEAQALSSQGILIAVEAPIALRYARTIERGRASDHISLQLFTEQERAEDANPDPTAQNISTCMGLATHMLTNIGDLSHLKKQVDEMINGLLY